MDFPVRRLLPLCLLLLVATSRCSCLTATTSTGQCEGRVGGVDVSGPLDPESEHHSIYPEAGATGPSLTELNLSCAQGKLKTRGRMMRVIALPSSVSPLPGSDGVRRCPSAETGDGGVPDAGASDSGVSSGLPGCDPNDATVSGWEVLAPAAHPKLVAGAIDAIRKLDTSVDGTVIMEFEDGSRVTIRFNAYNEDSLDVGTPPSSGGGGGGSDFD